MYRYGGRTDAPTLHPHDDAIYLALLGQGELQSLHVDRHYLADSLRAVAERLDCDYQAARLAALGLRAFSGYGRDLRDPDCHYVASCVTVDAYDLAPVRDLAPERGGLLHFDAEAAERLGDRLKSGLDPAEAIRRTVEQCTYDAWTAADVRRLERGANAWNQRMDRLDRRYQDEIGSPAHQAAIRELDDELKARGL